MLSVANVSLSKGRSYYQKENYYSKDKADEMSKWFGKLAAELGLVGNVGFKEFDNLLFGFTPDGSKELATNAVDPKKYQEPLLTKKDRGEVEFGIRKICDKFLLKDESSKKILNRTNSFLKYEKKITVQSAKEILTTIEFTLKENGIKACEKDEALSLYKHVIDKVTKPKERRAGYDLTFSAPKSVSILALVYKDKTLLKAHEESVKSVLTYIEKNYSKTRTGNNINRGIENTGKLAIATFDHDTSRALDPQLHTHCVLLNLIKREDGKYRSLHADDYRKYSVMFGTMYQSELAYRAKNLGYEIIAKENGTFDIKSVPEKMKELFSKRREQILEQGATDARSARTMVLIDRVSKGEAIDKNEQNLRWNEEISQFNLELNDFKTQQILSVHEQTNLTFSPQKNSITLQDSIKEAFNQASERNVSFIKEQALHILTKNTLGSFSIEKMTSVLHSQLETDLIKTSEEGEFYVTKEALKREKITKAILEDKDNKQEYKPYANKEEVDKIIAEKMLFSKEMKENILADAKIYLEKMLAQNTELVIEIIKILEDKISSEKRISQVEARRIKEIVYSFVNSSGVKNKVKKEIKTELSSLIAKSMILTCGQEEAIRKTLLSTEKHMIWLGVAGAGKTFSLRTVIEEAQKHGYDVKGFAQNADAAEVFSKETGIEARTVASLIVSQFDAQKSTQISKKLWIVDEAGMIGAKLGHDLVLRAHAENARLIIVGDIRQLSAPEAGHFLKFVTKHTKLLQHELTQSVRQKNESLANGVEILNTINPEKLYSDRYKPTAKKIIKSALGYFNESLVEHKKQETRVEKSVSYFLSLDEKLRNKTLIVAKTHKTIAEVTNQIRKELKEQKYLKNETMTRTFVPSNLSKGQLKYAINFEYGDLVMTDIKNPYLEKYKTYRVVKRDTNLNSITVDDSNGKWIEIRPKDVIGIMIYKNKEIEIAENDWMRWTKNERNKSRINKQMFKVISIDKETNIATICFEKGHTAQFNLNDPHYLDYAWAVTYNAAQGVTKKNIVGLCEASCNFEEVYTLFTRASHSMQIYVESKERLERSLLKSGSNRTATELVEEKGESKLIKKSDKMDFYDRYLKTVSFNDTPKNDKSIILSFCAPSDISAIYFTLEQKYKDKIIQIHENSIEKAISHFKKYAGIQGDFQLDRQTKNIIFDKEELSKIQYIHSIVKIGSILEDGVKKEVNRYPFIENQVLIKNLYEFYLAQNLKEYQDEIQISEIEKNQDKKNYSITIFQQEGILRVKERVNHVHAVFSEHFERNMKALKIDKFSSAHEINEKVEKALTGYDQKNKPLNWSHIVKDLENESEIEIQSKSETEIIRDIIYRASRDLQVFDELKLYESLIYESKGYLKEDDLEKVYSKVLISEEIRFLGHDRFGKMLFAHNSLSNEESNIIMTSIIKKDEKCCVLSFERVQRRLEKIQFDDEKSAALIHMTIDKGGIKFISGLSKKSVNEVVKEASKLYKNSNFKVINTYAGLQKYSDLNEKNDIHVRKLVEAIKEKKQILDKNTVIILNDLGKNISKTCADLLEYTIESNAKVILVADEFDLKTSEEKRFLNDLKRTSGVHYKTRYKGFLKQNEYHNRKHEDSRDIPFDRFKSRFAESKDIKLNKLLPEVPVEEKQRLHAIMKNVEQFYIDNLFSEQGKEARDYLINIRGFTIAQIREFGFGLSFTYGMQEFAKKKKYPQKDLEALSLITRKDNGDFYDFYRNRIMIPINNEDGHCVGFGGRIYRKVEVEKNVSKYINPRNTIIFNKSNILFGLDTAKESIKNEGVIVVEGYMDAITLKKEGVSNVVAVMGTAVSKENLHSLRDLTKDVTLFFDNDKAGLQATIRSLSNAKLMGFNLSCVSTKQAKDADEYLKENGVANLRAEVLDRKKPIDQVVTESYLEKFKNTQDTLEKIKIVNDWKKEVLPSILSIKNPMDRNFALKNASLVFERPLSDMVDKKHFKYIPRAFLSKSEINLLNESHKVPADTKDSQIIKMSENTFNPKAKSEEKIYELFRKIELNNCISDMLKTKEIEDIDTNIGNFIKESHLEVERIKSLIIENELLISSHYFKYKQGDINAIEIYTVKNSLFPSLSPHNINVEMKNKELELKEVNNNKPKMEKIFLDGEKEISNEELEIIRREMEMKLELKFECEFFLISKEEYFPVWDDFQKFPFSYKEKVFDNLFSKLLMDQREVKQSNNIRAESLLEHKSPFEDIRNKISTDPGYLTYVLGSMKEIIHKCGFEHKSHESQKIFERNLAIDENIKLRENVNKFENNLKHIISEKLQNKELTGKSFEEIRKILLKESMYLFRDESNQYKAYFKLIQGARMDLVKAILKDIDFKKLEVKYSSPVHPVEAKLGEKSNEVSKIIRESKLSDKLELIDKNFERMKNNFAKYLFKKEDGDKIVVKEDQIGLFNKIEVEKHEELLENKSGLSIAGGNNSPFRNLLEEEILNLDMEPELFLQEEKKESLIEIRNEQKLKNFSRTII